ncbi:MAG: zinc ribbon domain-containing protein [Anaerolineae bacterium]|jgi:putative FmdB family regulatory protein|nr:zinc ribbon domain-containing protein [Anaerolineae bacterium]
MALYDFRCRVCSTEFTLMYKTIRAYEAAVRACPACGSADLARVIKRVAVQSPARDYSRLSPGEMLSVLDSGDSRQVGQMFEQVGASSPAAGVEFHEATQRLLRGESMDKVEQRLQEHSSAAPTATATSTPSPAATRAAPASD